MPRGGGKKRGNPRKVYAQKARQQRRGHKDSGQEAEPDGGGRVSMIDIARSTETHRAWGEQGLRFSRMEFVGGSKISDDKETDAGWPAKGPEGIEFTALDHRTRGYVSTIETENAVRMGNESDIGAEQRISVESQTDGTTRSRPLQIVGAGRFIGTARPAVSQLESAEISQYIHGSFSSNDHREMSDSSEDVIIFTGRKPKKRSHLDDKCTGVQARTNEQGFVINNESRKHHMSLAAAVASHSKSRVDVQEGKVGHESNIESDADTAMEDYIANMMEQQQIESDDSVHPLADVHKDLPFRVDDGYRDNTQSDCGDFSSEDTINSADVPPDGSRLDRAKVAMTDEELARRLAKQEELGLDSSEILIWHGQDMVNMTDEERIDIEQLRQTARRYGKGRKPQRSRKPHNFLDIHHENFGGLSGEEYGEFDIMDLERPSLQLGGSRDRRGFSLQVSDSELEKRMIDAWENDRSKKKERKQKRELLIEASLNGGDFNGPEKHFNSASLQALKDDFREFCLSKRASLSLMPMDRNSRKMVHEVAIMLGLQSKSKGKGLQRYPCIYKTSRSPVSNAAMIDSVLAKFDGYSGMKQIHTPRRGYGKRTSTFGYKASQDKGSNSLSYRDGDTVGGDAPALGSDNKGHALLSKMGWTSGTALGARNNKGALEPIAQIVKSSRAGLG